MVLIREGNETRVPFVPLAFCPRNGAFGHCFKSIPGGSGFQKENGRGKGRYVCRRHIVVPWGHTILFGGGYETGTRLFSGLAISWEKSVILPIDPLTDSLPQQVTQIRAVNQMRSGY